MIDEEIIFEVEGEEPDLQETETQPEAVAEPPAPEPAAPTLTREQMYRFLAENPEEADTFRRVLGGRDEPRLAQPQPVDDDIKPPNPADYDNYDDQITAYTQYLERKFERRLEQSIAQVQGRYDPVVSQPIVSQSVNALAGEFGLSDDETKYASEVMSQLPVDAVRAGLSREQKELIAYAAKGRAMASRPQPTGHVEPVAGVGPVRYTVNTDRCTAGEWTAYVDMMRSIGRSEKEIVADAKQAGYLK
jgi:hypothetical protein